MYSCQIWRRSTFDPSAAWLWSEPPPRECWVTQFIYQKGTETRRTRWGLFLPHNVEMHAGIKREKLTQHPGQHLSPERMVLYTKSQTLSSPNLCPETCLPLIPKPQRPSLSLLRKDTNKLVSTLTKGISLPSSNSLSYWRGGDNKPDGLSVARHVRECSMNSSSNKSHVY